MSNQRKFFTKGQLLDALLRLRNCEGEADGVNDAQGITGLLKEMNKKLDFPVAENSSLRKEIENLVNR